MGYFGRAEECKSVLRLSVLLSRRRLSTFKLPRRPPSASAVPALRQPSTPPRYREGTANRRRHKRRRALQDQGSLRAALREDKQVSQRFTFAIASSLISFPIAHEIRLWVKKRSWLLRVRARFTICTFLIFCLLSVHSLLHSSTFICTVSTALAAFGRQSSNSDANFLFILNPFPLSTLSQLHCLNQRYFFTLLYAFQAGTSTAFPFTTRSHFPPLSLTLIESPAVIILYNALLVLKILSVSSLLLPRFAFDLLPTLPLFLRPTDIIDLSGCGLLGSGI